jgi:hypothetical protein
MSDDDFLAAFEARTIPKAEWTHAAHVRMAWLYLTRLPFAAALDRIRDGIRSYNAAVGSDGYHETITVAFTLLIRAGLANADIADNFADFCASNPDLLTPRGLLELHYDPATLASSEAKLRFVEPDRNPIPTLVHVADSIQGRYFNNCHSRMVIS